jgi:hypothetical protein
LLFESITYYHINLKYMEITDKIYYLKTDPETKIANKRDFYGSICNFNIYIYIYIGIKLHRYNIWIMLLSYILFFVKPSSYYWDYTHKYTADCYRFSHHYHHFTVAVAPFNNLSLTHCIQPLYTPLLDS